MRQQRCEACRVLGPLDGRMPGALFNALDQRHLLANDGAWALVRVAGVLGTDGQAAAFHPSCYLEAIRRDVEQHGPERAS